MSSWAMWSVTKVTELDLVEVMPIYIYILPIIPAVAGNEQLQQAFSNKLISSCGSLPQDKSTTRLSISAPFPARTRWFECNGADPAGCPAGTSTIIAALFAHCRGVSRNCFLVGACWWCCHFSTCCPSAAFVALAASRYPLIQCFHFVLSTAVCLLLLFLPIIVHFHRFSNWTQFKKFKRFKIPNFRFIIRRVAGSPPTGPRAGSVLRASERTISRARPTLL